MKDQNRRSSFAVWRWPWWKILLILPMLVPFEYAALYLVLLQGQSPVPIYNDEQAQVAEVMFPIYRTKYLPLQFHGMRKRVNDAMAPAHQIDCRLRPNYWEPWRDVAISREAMIRK